MALPHAAIQWTMCEVPTGKCSSRSRMASLPPRPMSFKKCCAPDQWTNGGYHPGYLGKRHGGRGFLPHDLHILVVRCIKVVCGGGYNDCLNLPPM
eukprot:5223201-Karenia_brevis.AAC.1